AKKSGYAVAERGAVIQARTENRGGKGFSAAAQIVQGICERTTWSEKPAFASNEILPHRDRGQPRDHNRAARWRAAAADDLQSAAVLDQVPLRFTHLDQNRFR